MLLQNLDIKQGLCNGPHHQTQNPPAFLAVLWPGGIQPPPPPPRDLGRRSCNRHENWHTRYLCRNLLD